MSQQLLEDLQYAYLRKDLNKLYELFPLMIRRIKNLESTVELMSRLTDHNEGLFEEKTS